MSSNPVKITDTTFRDAHQSLIATRLETSDMEPMASEMDSIGFHSMEVWGGATFDVATRFLAEDPWERLRKFKRLIVNTPLSMLLRGQSLVGYKACPDDVVDAFIQRAADTGVDIFRVFDALNDERNLQQAALAIQKSGKHLQMAICYSVTELGRLGGPIYTLDYFVNKAKLFNSMGADSICLKDMGGILAPYDAFELVSAIKTVIDVPLQLHTHYTSGMASMTVLKAIEAGIDAVDTCLAPLAMRTSQPAVEPLVLTLQNTGRDTKLDLDKLIDMGDYLEEVLLKYRTFFDTSRSSVIDVKVLSHQVPGGMASNLVSQLQEMDEFDKIHEVLAEIPNTRKDLGYPPLVTPLSQMVGSQSVFNVLFGRYATVTEEIKDYLYGLYGRPPSPIDDGFSKAMLKDYKAGNEPISVRPADLLGPGLENAQAALTDMPADLEDLLTYALYPVTGLQFLRIKHGLDPMPHDPPGPKQADDVSASKDVHGDNNEIPLGDTQRSPFTRTFNVFVNGERHVVEVDPVDSGGQSQYQSSIPESTKPVTKGTETDIDDRGTIKAPMPGIIVRYLVAEGENIELGDPVVVLESMKMENSLPAPISGQVSSLSANIGDRVGKGDVLAIVE